MIKLTSEEIRFFRDEGYVIKRKVLDETLMARARERLWENAPPEIKRNDPDTWVGPIKKYKKENSTVAVDTSSESNFNVPDNGGEFGWYYRSIGRENWMVHMLLTNAQIWRMAEQMLGEGSIALPSRLRGIYCRLPEPDNGNQSAGDHCHTDRHSFHLGVVGYIDDVPPNGGGFTVWPKSHSVFYYRHKTEHGGERTDEWQADIDFFKQKLPVECHGDAGDIIFCHHRLAHGVGYNRSKSIRKAVLGEFKKIDLEERMTKPPAENMWDGWPGISTDK